MTRRGTAVRAALAAAVMLALALLAPFAAADSRDHSDHVNWAEQSRERLRVGNTTAMEGRFFTGMWGGTTSDRDVRSLLHAYSPAQYDTKLGKYHFDHSVLADATVVDDVDGDRIYILSFYSDLKWSDGLKITASDYAFSILMCMDPVIAEIGGKPMDYSWIDGAEEYLAGTSKTLSGLRIINGQILQIRVKAEALPYFYELSRFEIYPYPARVIAPGIYAADDGDGARLTAPLKAETLWKTVINPKSGYLSHPTVVSGPYRLVSFSAPTAVFTINPFFKGTKDGYVPRIGRLEYTLAENGKMIRQLGGGEFGLLNKVTMSQAVKEGLMGMEANSREFTADNYARTGLTMIWFTEGSKPAQDAAVRKAVALCFDRDSFIRAYTGQFGTRVDGFYGIGQWMFRLASGMAGGPVDENAPEEEQTAARQAFAELNLDGLTRYEYDAAEAKRLLDEAGWTKGEDGIRYRVSGGKQTELRLTLGIPDMEGLAEALEENLLKNMRNAGIEVTLRPMSMDEIERVYLGEDEGTDMLYLGEDFPVYFDPEILAPHGDEAPENGLTAARAELYGMAAGMVRTEPDDLAGFMGKWIALQERITETLPLIPVYSNVYFDFYTRELHNYRIQDAVTWGEAVVRSYMSDMELPGSDGLPEIPEIVSNAEGQFR